MSRPIITAEGLSKAYRIGVELEKAGTLTGAAIGMLKAPVANFRRLRRLNTYAFDDDSPDIYWALKDVSFEIEEGEVVGIIGRNGAGKSTLLKLLSRITDPTRGRAVLRGRVSSLLEVGTGFHPELTGRENVYLNGTILGMTKREVDRKFDEIVEFSGVEKFLDTPTKRYSSGMTVRLAFAVAAHLEPEILVIDEVLAVGDAEFQKKCLGKMKDVAQGGRTVLFVSHSMAAVRQLCSSTLLLGKGQIVHRGTVEDGVALYLGAGDDGVCHRHWDSGEGPGSEDVRLIDISIRDQNGSLRCDFGSDEPIIVGVSFQVFMAVTRLRVGFMVTRADGIEVMYASNIDSDAVPHSYRVPGKYSLQCVVPGSLLNLGAYTVEFSGGLLGHRVLFRDVPPLQFTIHSTAGPTSRVAEQRQGVIAPPLAWCSLTTTDLS